MKMTGPRVDDGQTGRHHARGPGDLAWGTARTAAPDDSCSSMASRGKLPLGSGYCIIDEECRAEARATFLVEIELEAQDVLRSLRDTVLTCLKTAEARQELESFARARKQDPGSGYVLSQWIANAVAQRADVQTNLRAWAQKWGLTYEGEVPEWVRCQVLRALELWYPDPDIMERTSLNWGGLIYDERGEAAVFHFKALWHVDLRGVLADMPRFAVWNVRRSSLRGLFCSPKEYAPAGGQARDEVIIEIPRLQEELPGVWNPALQRESPDQAAERLGWRAARAVGQVVLSRLRERCRDFTYNPYGSPEKVVNRLEAKLAAWAAERLRPVLREHQQVLIESHESTGQQPGIRVLPKKTRAHFTWTVKHHCLGMTLSQIAGDRVRVQNVSRRVRDVLRLIGLTPRTRRGRPPKAPGRTPR